MRQAPLTLATTCRLRVWQIRCWASRMCKRALDLVVSGTALLFAAIPFAVIALFIKGTDGGPVFYCSERIGKNGKPFQFPKFRSMVVNAAALKSSLQATSDRSDGVNFKMKKDPRVTWIGRILRRWSLDELPQLWSVFAGDMSLVGPRPAIHREVVKYSARDRLRLEAQPGITCIWQVSGRADIPFDQQVQLDVQYINEQSLVKDCAILAATVPAVLSGKGAY